MKIVEHWKRTIVREEPMGLDLRFIKKGSALLAGLSVCLIAACSQAKTDPEAVSAAQSGRVDWAGIGYNSKEQRYVELDQVNADNIDRLGLVSTYDMSQYPFVVSAPVAADGIIYFASGLAVVQAVEASTGKLLWEYDPEVAKHNPEKMRIGWGTRGVTYAEGKIYWGTVDGRLLAVDAKSGELVWSVMTVEPDDARSITGPPRYFDGKVIIGHGGADYGPVRGYVTAYSADTGEQLWRFYTVPGNPADGFENDAMEMAAETWTGEWWKFGGGGTVWNAMTYDEELNRIYLGTGNGAPWNHRIRSPEGGDNLFLCSIVALDADTGEYIWHYQINPAEMWDYNAATEMVLADLEIDGEPRKVVMQAPKNGFFYVLDRTDGSLISAEPIAKVNWAEKIDLETGRPVEVPEARYTDEGFFIWPGGFGAHSWFPMAYSPKTKLVYIPVVELPGYYDDNGIDIANWEPEPRIQMNTGVTSAFDLDPTDEFGESRLTAFDPASAKEVWRVKTPAVVNGGVIATSTNLIFQNQVDGKFVARDATTGEEIWSYDLGAPSIAPPITFMSGGTQYFALITGMTGPPANANAGHIRFPARSQPKRLMVFALDGNLQIPDDGILEPEVPIAVPDFAVDEAKVVRGIQAYNATCFLCHGPGVVSGGNAPDLRASYMMLDTDVLTMVLKDGTLQERGMPAFSELSVEDIEAIQHYVRSKANQALAEIAEE